MAINSSFIEVFESFRFWVYHDCGKGNSNHAIFSFVVVLQTNQEQTAKKMGLSAPHRQTFFVF